MKRLIPLILALFAWGLLVAACTAPKLPAPTVEQKKAAAKTKFAEQLAACVDDNSSDYATEMCFRDTFKRWGKDGGTFQ